MAKQEKVSEKIAPQLPKGAYTITVIGSEGEKSVELKEVSKATFYKVFPLITPIYGDQVDMLGAGEIILRDCMISGDIKEFLTVDEYTISGAIQCVGILKFAEGSLKKN
jgi:hypothetical protein